MWGRVIDLDLLGRCQPQWREEVMERTGQFPLYIKGSLSGEDVDARRFLVDLLDNHWARIRKFDVRVAYHDDFSSGTWSSFQLPSPTLEVFKFVLTGSWIDSSLIFDTYRPLFADYAPSLREFEFLNNAPECLSLQAPWFMQLSALVLSSRFDATKVINAVAEITNLEYLELQEGIKRPVGHPRQRAVLPLLRKLSISNNIRTSQFLLHSITPSPGCSLALSTRNNIYRNVSDRDVDDMSMEISRYVENFLDVHNSFVDTLKLEYNSRSFFLKIANSIVSGPRPPEFQIDIYARFRLPRNAASDLLNSINWSNRVPITAFHYILRKVHSLDEEHPGPTFLITSLSTVTTLTTTEYGFETLLDKQNPSLDGVFSLLHTLIFRSFSSLENRDLFPQNLLAFLKGRRKADRPIAILDISETTTQDRRSWMFLEEISGLKVILDLHGLGGEEQYICGTGTPEKLDTRRVPIE